LPDYYRSASVFVIPTLEDNWSLVVPEAMASGLPVLSSVYNGCYPEYVTEDNGWVFDPLNSMDFEEKLIKSYHNSKLKQMGAKSREIISNYKPMDAADSIIKAIKSII